MNSQDEVRVGSNIREMLQNDLDVEYAVTAALKDAIVVCEEEQDFDSRQILTKLLDDTEMDHAYWREKQLVLIERIGLKNYLQSQM
jgi:bacterioferritin